VSDGRRKFPAIVTIGWHSWLFTVGIYSSSNSVFPSFQRL
jgi:hypothetical protein